MRIFKDFHQKIIGIGILLLLLIQSPIFQAEATYLTPDNAILNQAIREVDSTYGDSVSINSKKKSLLKFGRSDNVDNATTGYTIWFTGQDQAHETFVAANTNSIDSISSSNSGDTQTVSIEGHTESGGDKTFVVQTATLAGQTRVALGTALNRITRIKNTGSTNFAGNIFGYENTTISAGKPTDTTKIHITVNGAGGKNQSEKAATALSSQDYWIITNFYAGYKSKSGTNTADVSLQVRESGGVFRTVSNLIISTGQDRQRDFNPYLIVPKNADVRLVATSSTTNQEIIGGIQGYLAEVQ